MKRTLALVALFALLVVALGCGTKKGNVVAPKTSTVQSVRALAIGQSWTDKNGTTWTRLDALHMQSVSIGKITVIYVCDYPDSVAGPPAPGHCNQSGTNCT